MPNPTTRRLVVIAAIVGLATSATGCGDDDDGPDPATATTMPFVDGTMQPLDSTGGPGGSVLNNMPTSPAVNNAPPGSAGTG